MPNFMGMGQGVSAPQIAEILWLCVSPLPFPFLSFFLVVAYRNKKAMLSQGNRAMPL